MRYTLLAGVGAAALGFANPAMAGGNLFLTGHDDDFHCTHGDPNACAQALSMTSFVRQGSTLPVLVIDNGTELSTTLAGITGGIVTKTVGAVTATDFNHSTYSAFAVASVTSCGGCDNPVNTGATLATFASAISAFFNAGGGILGMTAATDSATGFSYVPQAAGGTAIGHPSGFVATAAGLAIPGFAAVNGDETHNVFTTLAPAYVLAELDNSGIGSPVGTPVTVFVQNGTITGTKITGGVPEPFSLSLLGVGLFGLGAARRYRRR